MGPGGNQNLTTLPAATRHSLQQGYSEVPSYRRRKWTNKNNRARDDPQKLLKIKKLLLFTAAADRIERRSYLFTGR